MTAEKNEEFRVYYEEHYRRAVGYTYKKIGDMEAAEDLTMEVFTTCYEKFEEFDSSKASFATWLYVILNNRIKNYYRDHKTFDEVDENSSLSGGFEDELLDAEYISQLRDMLADALESLNEVERQVVILKFFKNMNSKEIQMETGLSSENVRVISHRTMGKLKKYFEARNVRWEE